VLLDKPNGGSRGSSDYVGFQFPTNLWSFMGLIMPSFTETCAYVASYCLARLEEKSRED